MNDELQKRLKKLEEMMGIQEDCLQSSASEPSQYMHGMMNGMIYSHSLISGMKPDFYVMPKKIRRESRVRHKGKK